MRTSDLLGLRRRVPALVRRHRRYGNQPGFRTAVRFEAAPGRRRIRGLPGLCAHPICWVYAAGFLLWSAATAGTGISRGFAPLFGLRLLLGVGESVAYPAYAHIRSAGFTPPGSCSGPPPPPVRESAGVSHRCSV